MDTQNIIMLLMGVFGLFCLFLAGKSLVKVLKARSFTGETEGEIVEVQETSTVNKGRRYYHYYPVYQYTVNGTVYKKKFDVSTDDSNKYRVGQRAAIKYNESNPAEYLPEGGTGRVLSDMAFMGVIGIVIIGVVINMYMKGR